MRHLCRSLFRAAVCTVAALALLVASGAPAVRAQTVEQLRRQAELILGRPISNEEALRLLQQSGLTADQVRDLLAGRGYSPDAADPYLAVLEGLTEQVPGTATPVPLIEALTGTDLTPGLPIPDTLPAHLLLGIQALAEAEEPGPPIFGRDVFRRATTQFRSMLGGPAPADYRVGPDDELILVLTGDVELAYRLTVSREGWVAIPDVGRVDANGLTLPELRQSLSRQLSQVYSGLTGDASATVFLDLSLGALRTNLIYVIGEVEQPGAYEISGFASVFAALYSAGGPSRSGSFRRVRVNRGRATHATVDLYDYLLEGRGEGEPRLQQGDVIFVPVADRRVEVAGAVVRPAIYELADNDGLADVIGFAGGLTASASGARVQIERTLPPEQQEPGLNRVLLDIPLAGAEATMPLVDGDRITVFAVLEDLRNSVSVTGGVWRPGSYGVEPGMRLWDVIDRAGGLLPDVYEGRAQIQRLQPDYTRRMIQVTLTRAVGGAPRDNPFIEPLDQIYVFARRQLREQRAVSVGGWVREPGVYPYVDGMTVRDLVLRAGGLRTGAYLGAVDIARLVIAQQRGDTITRTFTVALDSSLVFDATTPETSETLQPESPLGPPPAQPPDAEFVLQNLDAVYVRKAPGFEPQRRVVVTGEVMFPGPYSLATRTERLTDLIARAGGLTAEGYTEGLQLWRSEPGAEPDTLTTVELAGQAFGDTAVVGVERSELPGVPGLPAEDTLGRASASSSPPRSAPKEVRRTRVGVDYVSALRDPQSAHNILIEPNDSIYVPSFIPTVDVRGSVQAPTKVVYKPGAGVEYYIRRAGGYQQDADKRRARVQLANGEVLARGDRFLFFGGGIPDPDPGSVITVPAKKPREGRGITFTEIATVLTGLATATATIIIAATR